REAHITSVIDNRSISWDLNVTCAPVRLNGQKLFALSLQDISSDKKLRAIERVFFHDLLNTAGGLNGLLTVLKMGTYPDELKELITLSEAASQLILEEIMSYRQLRAAENGDIKVEVEEIKTVEFLKYAISNISFHEVGQKKSIVLSESTPDITIQTDRLLLQRVMINLMKNALEATPVDGIVTVATHVENDSIIFTVHNYGVIPEEVRYHIFQRSFSTKDKNRGLGTYSVRLMTENYLKGKVSFISSEADGTVFSVEISRNWKSLL
ncbi:MAG TPA: ATP-binding protein, partial [Bacteroidales bacterium]|nr:ATP-binding protein [Bacteroidales bacterium]